MASEIDQVSDVEIFYSELHAAASTLDTATMNLTTETADVQGEDTGIENPAQRASLRLEMHTRLTALRDRTQNKIEAGSAVSSAVGQIATRYADLDVELTGRE